MKISIESYTFREAFGNEKTIKLLSDAGFDAMDFSYYWRKRADNVLGDDWKDKAKEIRSMLDANGLECNQAHAPFDVCYGENFSEDEPKYLDLARSIGSAAILGAKQIIVHALRTPDGVDLMEYNFEFYKSLEKYCEEYGIKVAVENLFKQNSSGNGWDGILGTPAELCKLTRELGKNFNCCVDIGHAAITGTAPQDFIAGMDSDLLCALHVQDNNMRSDCHWLPYQGNFNWEAVISALKAKNYGGDITLEVFGWLSRQPEGLLTEAARHAAVVASHLRDMFSA